MMWKLAIFLLIVAVGTVMAQNDDADSQPEPTPPPAPDRSCDAPRCEDGRNCWYDGDTFLKDGKDYICMNAKMEVKVDENAGSCLSHSSLGPKFIKPGEEYVLRCNTWKCSDIGVMLFVRAACRDDFDKCFEDGDVLYKNGFEVVCKIYGSGHAYEFPPEEAEPEVPAPEGGF